MTADRRDTGQAVAALWTAAAPLRGPIMLHMAVALAAAERTGATVLAFGDRDEPPLFDAVAYAVEHLDHLPAALPEVRRIAARYGAKGVRRSDIEVAGKALTRALETQAAPAMTASARDGWTVVWALISGAMIKGLPPRSAEPVELPRAA